jgi:uncharacterized membrane-anchored protein YhcB (DUF1043 family)
MLMTWGMLILASVVFLFGVVIGILQCRVRNGKIKIDRDKNSESKKITNGTNIK